MTNHNHHAFRESVLGLYPVEAVKTMSALRGESRILRTAEECRESRRQTTDSGYYDGNSLWTLQLIVLIVCSSYYYGNHVRIYCEY